MKRCDCVWKLSLAIYFVLIVGCGGGGGDSDNGTAPQITNVVLYRIDNGVPEETDEFWIGDESNLRIYTTDPDKDITHIVAEQYYPADATTPYYPAEPMPCPSQSGTNTVFYFITNLEPDLEAPTGNWRVDFYAIDSRGNESNTWTIYYVLHPAE